MEGRCEEETWWDEFEQAVKERAIEAGEEESDAECMFEDESYNLRRDRNKPVVIRLPGGDFHVCYGSECPHVEKDADSQLVCALTGLHVGNEAIREMNAEWTGRSTQSANPDDTAGAVVGGAWKKRRDHYAASVAAWQTSKTIDTADVSFFESDKEVRARAERANSKRGALCVDEVAVPQIRKRQRTSKKDMLLKDQADKLASEATTVIEKLLSTEKGGKTQKAGASGCAGGSGIDQAEDPRLLNSAFVRNLVIHKYVRKALQENGPLDLVTLHDSIIHGNDFVKLKRQEAEEKKKKAKVKKIGFEGRVMSLASNLIVSLWRAACSTPHMSNSKRGADSFRPFASGILYSMKRGFELHRNGKSITAIPRIPELADLLPTLRTPNVTAAAKQLHASSHRGLCSLHRSVASMQELSFEESEDMWSLFESASQAALCLLDYSKTIMRNQ